MKKIILFNTAIASPNKGDDIIMEACKKQLQPILNGNFVLELPTHTPISHWYQNFSKFNIGPYYNNSDYKFLCGTNLMNANMFLPTTLWNINLFNCKVAKETITIGVGMGSRSFKANGYTKVLLEKVLSKNYIHSTRDERTAQFLRSIGLQAINTGCATTWGLTNKICKEIPDEKSDEVIFTLTDYAQDVVKDKWLIEMLLRNYAKVYFWIQGVGDLDYLHQIYSGKEIIIVEPSLVAYDKILDRHVDYIGTRLHAGIRAMQKKSRAIIISVDNRTHDMKENINLCTISREELEELETMIYDKINVCLNINETGIRKWMYQFSEFRN